jgi:hypothetical protein
LEACNNDDINQLVCALFVSVVACLHAHSDLLNQIAASVTFITLAFVAAIQDALVLADAYPNNLFIRDVQQHPKFKWVSA